MYLNKTLKCWSSNPPVSKKHTLNWKYAQILTYSLCTFKNHCQNPSESGIYKMIELKWTNPSKMATKNINCGTNHLYTLNCIRQKAYFRIKITSPYIMETAIQGNIMGFRRNDFQDWKNTNLYLFEFNWYSFLLYAFHFFPSHIFQNFLRPLLFYILVLKLLFALMRAYVGWKVLHWH